jgi:hypothetical protein
MGRILDLCGEIAAEAEEGTEGLVLPPEAWDRFRGEWSDEDIEDALGLVRDSLLQGELVAAADSLSARLVEVLGALGTSTSFEEAVAGKVILTLETIGQLARRVDRLEEVLEVHRDWGAPDRRGFDSLRRRLADHGIEDEMDSEGGEADGNGSDREPDDD